MRELRNGRVALALHTLQAAEGMPLLLLHELGGSAQDFRASAPAWPGPVHALDFGGHGYSGRLYGGGYYPELWAADADLALAAIGDAVLFGAGLGAYVALLLAGGRPEQVRCAVLAAGAGLVGGAPAPTPERFELPDVGTTPRAQGVQAAPATDPSALEGQDVYLRPPEYAARFARRARSVVLIEDGGATPPWWNALRDLPSVTRRGHAAEALRAALAAARGEASSLR